jgi:hypothetical protein
MMSIFDFGSSGAISSSRLTPTGEALRTLAATKRGLARWWHCPDCRSMRVIAMLLAIALMSAGDFVMTLEHLRGPGLAEANPIARYVIEHGSAWVLGAFKFGSVGLAIGILYAFRRRRLVEAATFGCFCVLAALCVQWIQYSDDLSMYYTELAFTGTINHPNMVELPGTAN